MHRMLLTTATLGVGLLSACGRCPDYEALPGAGDASDTLFLGDSVLAWHDWTCEAVPHEASFATGRYLTHAAVSGAPITRDGPGEGDITQAWEKRASEQWSWVVLDGGANDVNQECDCQEGDASGCDAVVDTVISADGGDGDLVDLVADIEAQAPDAAVLLLGYYPLHPEASDGWQTCAAHYQDLNVRYEALAETYERVRYLDLGTVMDPSSRPELYGVDFVHPSKEGSAAMGRAVAAVIGDEAE